VLPTMLPRVLRTAFVLLFAALVLASCGGGDDREDVEDLLDRAFQQEIQSADLAVDASLQLEGSPSFDGPLKVQASGPFRANEGGLPAADIELRVGTDGGGQTIQTGFLSTGGRAFVKFQDVYFEQPAADVRRANEAIQRNENRRGSLRALGLDPRSWLGRARDEGEEEIGGVQTRHVSGTLDVEAVMRNLNEFVRKSSATIGGATGQPVPRPLSARDIRVVEEVVRDPSFDVYVGVEDDVVRRVSGRVEFDVPEERRESMGGIKSGAIEFSVELTDVNGDQRIEAPAKARPLSELTRSLGGAALGELGRGQNPLEAPNPDDGAGPDDAPSPETGDFRLYADCLDKAQPEDTAALQRCAELLERP